MKIFNTQTLTGRIFCNSLNLNSKTAYFGGINYLLFTLFVLVAGIMPIGAFAQVLQRFQNPGSFTFTVPAGVTSIKVEAWGAGGGGALNPSGSNNDAAGGGGGGAYATSVLEVIPGQVYQVLVGEGGGVGENGGNTQFSEGFGASLILVRAEAGFRGDISGRDGGRASMSIGQFRFSGGAGGTRNGTNGGGGGGGGSAFINANGGAGANAVGNTGGNGGTGTGNGGRGRCSR